MKIMITEPAGYSEEALEVYRRHGKLILGCENRKNLLDQISQVDVVVIRLGYQLDKEFFNKASCLRYIVTPTTGLSHIDLDFIDKKNICLISLKDENDFLSSITPTAELTWGLLLALMRRLPQAISSVLDCKWNRELFYGQEVFGKTLGIVGYGRLGRMVARYGVCFGMKVIAADPNPLSIDQEVDLVDHHELYRKSDIVSIHVPLTSYTKEMIGFTELKTFKESAILINTSRGELIDEDALLYMLKSRILAGAALDVLARERQDDQKWLYSNKLLKYAQTHENLIITPHIGGATPNSMRRTELFMAHKFSKYVD